MEKVVADLEEQDANLMDLRFKRINSFDFLNGIAISLLVLIQLSYYWLNEDWLFLYALLSFFLDVLASNLLIFASTVSVVFSMRKRMGFFPERSIRNIIIKRGILMMFLGVIYNVVTNLETPMPYNFWGWNLLMIIGFSQIYTYFALKMARGFRASIGALIIFFTPQIREFLFLFKNNFIVGVLHYIFISPHPEFPLIPYLALCIFSTIFGENFLEAVFLGVKKAYIISVRYFVKYGAIFLLLGIFFGYNLINQNEFNSGEYLMMDLLPLIQNQSFFAIEGIPGFLISGTSANMFYVIGIILIISGITIYFIDIKQENKKKTSLHVKIFKFYGRNAFSLYFLLYLGTLLFYRILDVYTIWPIWISFLGILGLIMYIWRKYAHGIGTIEWIRSKIGPLKY